MPVVVAVVVVLALAAGLWWLRRKMGSATPGASPIDPFTVGERWRHHVLTAQSSLRRYRQIVNDTPAGPLRDKLNEISRQVERGVGECWQIAKRGNELDNAIERLGGRSLRARLDRASDDATKSSLEAQLASVERLQATRDEADAQLHLLNTRLGEMLAGAAEISVGGEATDALGTAVDDVVVQLEALRQAVNEVDAATKPAALPPEVAREIEAPQPTTDPPSTTGQGEPGQSSPAT